MIVHIRDRDALSSISIVSLRAYLNSRGWTDSGIWGERPITVFAKEHEGRTLEILVPHRDTIGGYAENMAESVAVLAAVEERSELDVFYDLAGTSADVIQLRSANGKARELLSLRQSASMLNDAYGMLEAGARAAEKHRAIYRGKLSADVAEYLDSVHPLPGYSQGYALTLHSRDTARPRTLHRSETGDRPPPRSRQIPADRLFAGPAATLVVGLVGRSAGGLEAAPALADRGEWEHPQFP